MSVLDGPGEGTWSVFASKVVEERDEARAALAAIHRAWSGLWRLRWSWEAAVFAVEGSGNDGQMTLAGVSDAWDALCSACDAATPIVEGSEREARGLEDRLDLKAEVDRLRGVVERMKAEEERRVWECLTLRDVADRAISDRAKAEVRSSALLEEIGRLQSKAERHRTYHLLVDGFARETMTPAAYETLRGFAEILEAP